MTVQIERIQKDIGIINAFNATPEKGITRLTFSEEYQGAIAYVVDELKQVGAKISYCQAGNIKAGMIFVPSEKGRSHCPEEFTRPEDIGLGRDLLLATVITLAKPF